MPYQILQDAANTIIHGGVDNLLAATGGAKETARPKHSQMVADERARNRCAFRQFSDRPGLRQAGQQHSQTGWLSEKA